MREPDANGPARVDVLATDFDRTLTDESLRVSPRALDALARARKAGLKVVVVSGRDLPFLVETVGHVSDAIIAENGALMHRPGLEPKLVSEARQDLRSALSKISCDVAFGDVIASADIEHEPLLREAIARAGLDVELVPNRDRVMMLPRGIDKATGLVAALRMLDTPPERAAAAGDGENDLPLLRSVGYAIAVANAVEDLKRVAHHVTRRPGGEGLADWVEGVWLPARGAVHR